MKHHIPPSVLAAACGALLLLTPSPARSQDRGLYAKADAGAVWTSDVTLKEFFGPVAPGSTVKFKPGARFGLKGGYQLTDWFSIEGETGFMSSSIDTITDATRIDNASLTHVPFLLNARFQCPTNRCPVTPFIGGGVGGAVSTLNADHITIGGVRMNGNEADTVFAYQAFGGLCYNLNSRMGISLEYHYFVTTGADWKASSSAGTDTEYVRFGGVRSHAMSVAFQYRF